MADAKFTVGQEVFLEDTDRRALPGLFPATVTKIGRQWVWLGDTERFDPDPERYPRMLDGRGYQSTTRVWISREEAADYTARDETWKRVRKMVADEWRLPAHLSAADLEQIADKLKVPKA